MQTACPSPYGLVPEVHPGRVLVEPPDLLWVIWEGHTTLAQMVAVYAFLETFARGAGSVYLLQDLSGARGLAPEARRLVATDERTTLLAANACYGAPFHVRVMATMVERAIRLIRGAVVPVAFVSSEAEARIWLDAQRDRRRGSAP